MRSPVAFSPVAAAFDKLFKLVAAGRIPARRAENLTYLAQLLLHSQKDIRYETNFARRQPDAWRETVRAAYPVPEPEEEEAIESEEQAESEEQTVPGNES